MTNNKLTRREALTRSAGGAMSLAAAMTMLNEKLIHLFQSTSLESIATQRIAV